MPDGVGGLCGVGRGLVRWAVVGACLWLLTACAARQQRSDDGASAAGPLAAVAWARRPPLRFLVLGDTQNPPAREPQNDAARQAIYARCAQALQDSVPVFHVGDVVDNGSRPHEWVAYFDRIFWEDLPAAARRRFYAIPGNHDYKTHWLDFGGGDLRHFRRRFAHLGPTTYYYLVQDRSAFVCLDSGRNGVVKLLRGERWQNVHREQRRWLEQVVLPDLRDRVAAGALEQLFVFYHKPAYATPHQVKNRDSVAMLELFAELVPPGSTRPAVFTFSGHIHTFSHIQVPAAAPAVVVEQFTMGGGGGTQRGSEYFGKITSPEGLDRYRHQQSQVASQAPAGSAARLREVSTDDTHFGYLEVLVGDPVTVRYWRFVAASGGFRLDYEFVR